MNQTLEFAQQELARYLNAVTGCPRHEIRLSVSAASDSPYADEYAIDVTGGAGYITGCCPRSVLLGVYRFLFLIGCRFFAPGSGGETIPTKPLSACTAKEHRLVPIRHRGICIEGAVSRENVLDMIDWLPKVGFNSYFIQFRESDTFFERWYTHQGSLCQTPEPFCKEDSKRYVAEAEAEIAKRDLLYHKVGHGWTCECIGYPSTGWHKVDSQQLSDDIRGMLAQVHGVRGFYEGIPLNTHLCYSQPDVRRRMVEEVVNYAQQHQNISILHIWLADNYNNICECEQCRAQSQTDWYVTLLNEIDEALTRKQLPTKLVFLIYYELLWPPEKLKLLNPQRFLLMFAPITRTYTRPFYQPEEAVYRNDSMPLPAYTLNEMVFPTDVKENLRFLYRWQQEFSGDSFDFDYHLMWDIDKEMGGLKLAKVIHQDCTRLSEMGLGGLMSCQQNRASFPSGICQYVMGRTLFDPTCSYEQLVAEYAEAAYGEDSPAALAYLQLLSDGFSQAYFRNEPEGRTLAEYAIQFRKTATQLETIAPEIYALAEKHNQRAWNVLRESVPIFRHLAHALVHQTTGASPEIMQQEATTLRQLVSHAECQIQQDLDAMYFNLLVGSFLEQNDVKSYQS